MSGVLCVAAVWGSVVGPPKVESRTGTGSPNTDKGCVEVDSSVISGTCPSVPDKDGDPLDASVISGTCTSVANEAGDLFHGAGACKGEDLPAGSGSALRDMGAANTGFRMERTRRV